MNSSSQMVSRKKVRIILKYLLSLSSVSLALLLLLASPLHAQQICDPANPDNGDCQQNQRPGCYHCELVNNVPNCVPNDAFCDDISGGNASNECRSATCLPNIFFTNSNPSGCDYDYSNTDLGGTSCQNCQPDVASENCGNGICEAPGETFANCSIDCRAPGFVGPKLDPNVPADALTLNSACAQPAGISLITFPGPDYNQFGSQFCEDGDICTQNTCGNGFCQVTDPATCNPVADFCCPSGCTPPAAGTACPVGAVGTTCDPDCLPPQSCEPTPLPSPTPIPPTVLCLEGSGDIVGGESVLPSCDTCSLHKDAKELPTARYVWLSLFGLGLSGSIWLRKRASR